jgi:glycosyltransferase involved in cell wall biosynthesis
MRIAVLSTLPATGGAGGAAWRLTHALTNFGHECSFFILQGSSNPLHIPLLHNDGVLLLPALFSHWNALVVPEAMAATATDLFSDTITALHASHSLPKAIHEAEVIHLHWVAGILFSPALLSLMTDKKIIWTLHDTNAFTGGCHYTGTCRSFQSQCRDCRLLKKPSNNDASAKSFLLKERLYPLLNPSIVTPSTWLAEEVKNSALLKKYPVTTIPNPLDLKIFQPPLNRQTLRRKLGLPENAFVILSGCESLGNFRKNTKAFYEALALISEQVNNLPLVVMLYGHGHPPRLAFPVHHFGYVSNEVAMAELYGAADLFVHTSLQDNLPLTLCEAQACGTPTLSFDVGGCPETMLPGETGFLVAETTSQALAEKLRAIITARDSLYGMREAVRTFAEKQFDPAIVATAYTKVFEKTKTAPGLKTNDALYDELLQNQTASLALLFHESNKIRQKIRQHPLVRKTERYWQPIWRRVKVLRAKF